jgi:23S rRNA pseudouridine2605 synthase
MTQPAKVEQVRTGDNPWFEVTLTEGRNRQLRKMFEEIGHHVEKIRRIGYGALVLDVPPGGFRELTGGEVQALNRAAAGKSVERKKVLPEAAQLKKPLPPRKEKKPKHIGSGSAHSTERKFRSHGRGASSGLRRPQR